MAKANYIQRGEALDYTNGTANPIGAGDVVVMGRLVGVAGCDIPVGATGSLHVMGVFAFPKGAAPIAAGTAMGWDVTAGQATEGGGLPLGYATDAADAADAAVTVLLDRSAAIEES